LAAQHRSHESRGYTMRVRQENVDLTRLRITEATMRLHEQVGPAATTVSAIADLAGVTRLTVYRHFPDEESIVRACSGHWRALHPGPDPTTWVSIDDPVLRLRTALSETYAWAAGAAPMMTKIYRDLHLMPTCVAESLSQEQHSRVAILSKGFPALGRKAQRLRAALTHAVDFRTWHSLCVLGALRDDEAIELMLAAVSAAIHASAPARTGGHRPAPTPR
jgi:AcrR family transcriptional regulator